MKNLLLVTVLGGGLVLPYQRPSPPVIALASVPATIQPVPQVGVIPAAIVIGVGVGVIGVAAVKAVNAIINIWERKVTNGPPAEVVFSFDGEESGQ